MIRCSHIEGTRLRVLQLVSLAAGAAGNRGAGGPEIRAAESLRYWDGQKVELIIGYSINGALISEFRGNPGWVDFVINNKKRISTLRRLVTLIVSHKVNVVHTQGPIYTDFIATLASRIAGVPNVVTRPVQVSDLQCGWLKHRAFLLMDRCTKQLCSAMVAITCKGRKTLVGEGCPQSKVSVIVNGVDVDKFSPRAKPSYDRSQDELLIGMFAQMVPHKRQDLLIRMMGRVRNEGRRWRLLLVGDGPERPKLQELVSSMSLEGCVDFLGFRRDLPGLYASVDVVALASEREGLPITLLEGMASGRVCVASGVGGVIELIEGSDAGVVIRENSEEEFFKALAMLDDDRNRMELVGSKSRKVAVERFSIQAMVSAYENVYSSVACPLAEV